MTEKLALDARAAGIKMVLFDCDGVLTDGTILVTPEGEELRRFHVHDGYGIRLLQKEGVRVGLVSGKASDVITARAECLNMDPVRTGCREKGKAVEEIIEESGLSADEVVFVGDDVFDIPAMEAAGISVAVSNARPEVIEAAEYVTKAAGGAGAAREIAEAIIRAKEKSA